MIRDIEINLTDAQHIAARLLKYGDKVRRLYVEIDDLIIWLDLDDAEWLRDEITRVLREQPTEGA